MTVLEEPGKVPQQGHKVSGWAHGLKAAAQQFASSLPAQVPAHLVHAAVQVAACFPQQAGLS